MKHGSPDGVPTTVTIVGMRFYQGAHDYLLAQRWVSEYEDKRLFLVPEVNNRYDTNAIMLHNGKQKLGSVSAEDAARLRPLFDANKDQVLVCNMDSFSGYDKSQFSRLASIKVYPKQWADERPARKYADLLSKKGK